ncbi:pseudouridine-5'-phosphate glycosidase [Micromonospora profundi]|nr:pseudouridine-5'-phosphate glycosidase [Micromonospora profundi]
MSRAPDVREGREAGAVGATVRKAGTVGVAVREAEAVGVAVRVGGPAGGVHGGVPAGTL